LEAALFFSKTKRAEAKRASAAYTQAIPKETGHCAIDVCSMNPAIIQVENLTKRYGHVEALNGVSFDVHQGEVFGLLGPNGAGKTSTVEILEGLRNADSGRVSVCGLNPERETNALKHEIGAALQSTALPEKMRVCEALSLFSRFYKRRRDPDELLKRFGLEEKRDTFYSHLSGGQKQRLALAMALVNDPSVVFFDEPTAGLDPQVRREIYGVIEELRRDNKTLLLTTHYIEEAERLCDRVAIVDHGKVIALGTPRELKQRSGDTTRIEVRLARPESDGALRQLEGVADCRVVDGSYVLHSSRPPQTIVALVKHLEAHGNELASLEIATPSLEDVFLELTGRRLRD
jgi:ABC-2 type transport system ATP-binding protein